MAFTASQSQATAAHQRAYWQTEKIHALCSAGIAPDLISVRVGCSEAEVLRVLGRR